MTDEIVLDAARTAALLAPAVDRLRMAVMRRALALGMATIAATGLEHQQAETLGLLRNLGSRPLPPPGPHPVLVYRPPADVDADVSVLVERGFLVVEGDGLVLGVPGHAFVEEVHRFTQQAVNELWPEERVAAVEDLVGRALEAARADGGPAFGIMAPTHPRPASSPGAVLAEALTGLRFHRYDAHVAAWRATGLTAEEATRLQGARRDAVEAETNRRAATPYAALDPDERLALLAGLATLPG